MRWAIAQDEGGGLRPSEIWQAISDGTKSPHGCCGRWWWFHERGKRVRGKRYPASRNGRRMMDLAIYCGPAPTPEELWSAWNFDPPVLAGIAAIFLFLMISAKSLRQRLAAWTSLLLMLLAFVSPLCALASALFSARVAHHVVLVTLLAPAIILAIPPEMLRRPRFPAQLSFIT
ncbi:MAG: hypothetical protein ACK4UZ_13410, partial [Rhizobium rhizophilum]